MNPSTKESLVVFHEGLMATVSSADEVIQDKSQLKIVHNPEVKEKRVKPLQFENEEEAGKALRRICDAILGKDSSIDLNIK